MTGYTVGFSNVEMSDESLFKELQAKLETNNKQVDLLFGVPKPYSGRINERGLVQVLTTM